MNFLPISRNSHFIGLVIIVPHCNLWMLYKLLNKYNYVKKNYLLIKKMDKTAASLRTFIPFTKG
jgi:hypothetical protein